MSYTKLIALSALIASQSLAPAVLADIDKFVFESKGEVVNIVSIPRTSPGMPVASVRAKGDSTVTYASGRVSTDTWECTTMTQIPRGVFSMHGMCAITDADGDKYNVLYGCNYLDKEHTQSSCVGGIYGASGKYEGRRGTASWYQPDGGNASGSGQWYD